MAQAPRTVEHAIHNFNPFDVSFDIDAFDVAIRSHGVQLIHYRAQRCPVGMTDIDDIRRPHPHHEGCQNGFIYDKVGKITTLVTSNSKTKRQEDVGFIDFSTIQATFPRQYDDSEEAFVVAPFDRFYLCEESLTVVMWQLFTHHETDRDRLKYPVVDVQGQIIDYRGERYTKDIDFKVCNGTIEWTGTRRPAPEVDVGPGVGISDRGGVCSVRYLYRPYWYVGAIPHEIRVSGVQNEISGERKTVRMPQAAVLHREYVSQNTENKSEIPLGDNAEELRRFFAPMNGGFSPK